MKYVENVTPHKVNVTIYYDDVAGAKQFGIAKKTKLTFRPEKVNTFSNSIENTAFTSVDDDVYIALSKNTDFRYALEASPPWLRVHDELPEEVQTPSDALVNARRRIQELEALLAQGTDGGALAVAQADLKVAEDALDKAMVEKTAMAAHIKELEGKLESSKGQVKTVKKSKEDAAGSGQAS